MNAGVKYFAKKIGTEIVVSGAIFLISTGAKIAAKQFMSRKTDNELKELLKDD